jgi:hypothetical protein
MPANLNLIQFPQNDPIKERLHVVAAHYGQSKDLELLEENLFLIKEFLENFCDYYSGQQAMIKVDELLFWVTYVNEELNA